MHHALDAATLALVAHYFPLQKHGQDQKGILWKAMLKRTKSEDEIKLLTGTRLYKPTSRPKPNPDGTMRQQPDAELTDLPAELKQALSRSLAQARVMQHIPADRSGAKTKLTTWGVVEVSDGRVKLRQRSFIDETGKPRLHPNKSRSRKENEANPNGVGEDKKWIRAAKLLGPEPKNGVGKLASIKGAIVIEQNYGLALDPKLMVIPFHDVSNQLSTLREANGGKPVRVLRNGMLIHLEKSPARSKQNYSGVWRIVSVKNNKGKFLIDMIRPDYITAQNGVEWSGMNKMIEPLLACNLTILPRRYTGHPLTY